MSRRSRVVRESWGRFRAQITIRHQRRSDYDEKRGLWIFKDVDPEEKVWAADSDPEKVWNLVTNAGRVQAHKQVYDTTGLLTNGFNYIGLTNDATAPAAGDTSLPSEIAANGLTRAQGTVTPPTGSGTITTVDKTFTATGTQSAQQTALFTASSSGVMNHHASFTQRNLINTDTIQITFSCTLG